MTVFQSFAGGPGLVARWKKEKFRFSGVRPQFTTLILSSVLEDVALLMARLARSV